MSLQTKPGFLLCFALAFAGCRYSLSRQKLIPDKDTVITLSRGPCYGRCHSYTVTVKGDGTVTF